MHFSKLLNRLALLNSDFGLFEGVGDGEGVGVGLLIATPLFQTNFLPDLTQVNFLPEAMEVDPALAQLAPVLIAPIAGDVSKELIKAIETTKARVFFMEKDYLALLDLSAPSSRIGGDSSTRRHRPCVARKSSKN